MAQAVDTARVLIVDDNMNALRALEYVLDRAGFDVDCAASGSVALDRLRQSSYDVVVSDLKMPGMSGLELLNSIQSFRPGLPVLILTAHGTIDNAVEAVRHGAVDYLQKPFPTSDIAAKVLNNALFQSRASMSPNVPGTPNRPSAPSSYARVRSSATLSPEA